MPGYGVPEGGELLPWAYAEQRLTEAREYWLATIRPDGRPHLAVVWAVWTAGRALFSTGRDSRKAANLRGDERCSLAPRCAAEAESVVVDGRARPVARADLGPFVAAVRAKYGYDMSDLLDEPVFAVQPETVIALDETFTAHATRFTFDG